MKTKAIAFLGLIFLGCQSKKDAETLKKEIADAEKSFETMAAQKGIAEAFWHFAADSAVIKRENDTLIIGRNNIRNYYSKDFYKKATVKWSPDFISVSADGDMAYTYGKYLWQAPDTSGKNLEYRGVFHTVWKRQKDGSWKYVWD